MAGKALVVLPIIALLAGGAHTARAEVNIADPGTYVVDTVNLIPPATEAEIERLLGELQRTTGAQVKVLTVGSTEGEDFFGFVQRHAEKWALGQAGKDNGALIALSHGDRQVRIHTGYGVEHVLPDSRCGSISREARDRFFRSGSYALGLHYMASTVAADIAKDAGVSLTGLTVLAERPPDARPDPPVRSPSGVRHTVRKSDATACGCCGSPVFLVLVVLILLSRSGQRHGRWRGGGGGLGKALLWGILLNQITGGRRRGGWGGGGFGGFRSGLGGGFGGFGGGSFGGGGRFGGGGGGASW